MSGKLFEVGAGMEHKSEDPDYSGNTWSRLDTAVVLVRFAMLLIIIISWLLRFLPTQQAQTGLAAFVLGALLWKIFPWEVGPKFGLRNGFFRTTAERGRSALILISTWAGIGAVIIGVYAGAEKHLTATADGLPDTVKAFGDGSVWV
ncbi:hypothetical protein ACIPYU_18130 [Paenarthrobacter nicotinovorans]|uniref:hypothetical protein n=1 Tax=Paenarthrobacter nicotinovorans TaxID=29320 RepID=UPI00381BB451